MSVGEAITTTHETSKSEPTASDRSNVWNSNVDNLDIEKLRHFKNHPYSLYDGQLFTDMVESIKTNGLFYPIIVRPIESEEGDNYEILSGHNRLEATKVLGYKTIPAIIRQGLNDNEALLVVTETNLIQRKFEDMSHSERATSLATHYEAMKKKSGYRSDLLKEIEELTNSPVAKRSSMDNLGKQHGLSKDTIARYLRVDKLTPELKKKLDQSKISLRSAVTLSYLRHNEQKILDGLLGDEGKITMTTSYALRKESASASGALKKTDIEKILKSNPLPVKIKPYTLSDDIMMKYFNDNQGVKDIEKILSIALEQYNESINK